MILDQYGKEIVAPPSPYDAIMADFMRDTIATHLRDSAKMDLLFDATRLVDERGHPVSASPKKKVIFRGRNVRVPFTAKESA